jgi:hypothetical protein
MLWARASETLRYQVNKGFCYQSYWRSKGLYDSRVDMKLKTRSLSFNYRTLYTAPAALGERHYG